MVGILGPDTSPNQTACLYLQDLLSTLKLSSLRDSFYAATPVPDNPSDGPSHRGRRQACPLERHTMVASTGSSVGSKNSKSSHRRCEPSNSLRPSEDCRNRNQAGTNRVLQLNFSLKHGAERSEGVFLWLIQSRMRNMDPHSLFLRH